MSLLLKKKIQQSWQRITDSLRLLLARPRLEDTEEARSFERYRRCAWTCVVMLMMRFANIFIGIITVPLTLNYLGSDLFGIWMILTSIIGFASFADLGLGVGLRNSIIKKNAVNDTNGVNLYIWNAVTVLCLVAAVLIVLALGVVPFISWGNIIKCSEESSILQIAPAITGMLIAFAVTLPITQLLNIASGFQRAYWGYGCYLIGRIASLGFIWLCVKFKWSLGVLAAGYIGTPTLCLLIGWMVFLVREPRYLPRRIQIKSDILKELFGIGGYSLLHNISHAVLCSSSIFIIGHTINSAASVPYSVVQKVFGLTSVFSASLLMGLSVAVGDAWHSKNFNWIKGAIHRSLLPIFGIVIGLSLIIILAGKPLILLWTRNLQSEPTIALLITCALLNVISIYASIYSGFLMSMNYVREVAVYQLICGIVAVAISYIVGITTQNATWTAFSYLIGYLPCALSYHKKFLQILKTAEGDERHIERSNSPCHLHVAK